MNVAPETTLIEAAIGGDAAAIEQLLLAYRPTITRFAHRFCATPEDVEDAVQETLWTAAQRIGTLRVTSAFASWLFKVVRHQCLRLLRRSWRQASTSPHTRPEQAEDSAELRIALRWDIAQAIADLPPVHRQVFIMRDIEGLSAREVATALEITVEAVKSRLHRARHSLRQSLHHWKSD